MRYSCGVALADRSESVASWSAAVASLLLMMVSGWVHRHQLLVIEFLQVENRRLKERLRGKRIRLTDAERALLARKAKAAGRSPA